MSTTGNGGEWSTMEGNGASNAGAGSSRVAMMARADQQAAEIDQMVEVLVRAARADLTAGVDPLRITEAAITDALENGPTYAAGLLARAVLRLARVEAAKQ